MHGPGHPANAHKLRTGQWQYFGGTSTHHSLPLDETASNYWVSRSRKSRVFLLKNRLDMLVESLFSRGHEHWNCSSVGYKGRGGASLAVSHTWRVVAWLRAHAVTMIAALCVKLGISAGARARCALGDNSNTQGHGKIRCSTVRPWPGCWLSCSVRPWRWTALRLMLLLLLRKK